MPEGLVVRRETHIPAPPAAVFALMTDPEKILRWMGTEAQVDPQPGGLYLVNVTGARFARGSFREVVPVHRLAYSFGWDGSEEVQPGATRAPTPGTATLAGTDCFPLSISPYLNLLHFHRECRFGRCIGWPCGGRRLSFEISAMVRRLPTRLLTVGELECSRQPGSIP